MEKIMNKIIPVFNEIWAVEFYRGVLVTVGIFFALLVLSWIIKLIIFLKYGKRRCSSISVNSGKGMIISSTEAVTAVLRSELERFKELEISRISIFCKRGEYSMELRCVYCKVDGFRGLPELFAELEPQVREYMKNIFGLEELAAVDIRIVSSDNFDELNGADDMSSAPDGMEFATPENRQV